MIKKQDGKYYVVSKTTGKKLAGPFATKAEAVKRLREIEYYGGRK